jgi:tetratricopeptide (TPR) repeat protein
MATPPDNLAGETKEEASDYWVGEGEKYWSESDKTVQSALKALEFIDKAISIDPLNYKAWGDKGFLLKQMGEYDSALMCLERALGFKNDFIPSLYNKAVLLGLTGKFDEAIETYEKVLSLDPKHNLAKRDLEMLLKIKHEGWPEE